MGIHTWANLGGAINDVKLMQGVLRTRFDFQDDDFITLLNEQATHSGIENAFKTLIKRVIKNRESLLAMGAPIYSGKTSKMPSKLDFKMARGLVQHNDYSRAFRQLDLKWRDLPGTLEELSALK